MPKSRTRKHLKQDARREYERSQASAAVARSTKIRLIVESFTRQSQLDTMLLQEPDSDRRRQMFAYILPFVKFPNPVCPSPLDAGSLLVDSRGRPVKG